MLGPLGRTRTGAHSPGAARLLTACDQWSAGSATLRCGLSLSVRQYLVNQNEMAVKWLNGKSMTEGEGPVPRTAGGGGKVFFVCLGCGGDWRRGAWRGWASLLCSTSVLCTERCGCQRSCKCNSPPPPQGVSPLRVQGLVNFLLLAWQGSGLALLPGQRAPCALALCLGDSHRSLLV